MLQTLVMRAEVGPEALRPLEKCPEFHRSGNGAAVRPAGTPKPQNPKTPKPQIKSNKQFILHINKNM